MRNAQSGPDENPDPLERGLAAGYGASGADSAHSHGMLGAPGSHRAPGSGVRLPDPPGEDRPVLKPGTDPAARTAGRYQILGEIAHGGVGVVYQAHDLDLGRDVALKLLHERFQDRHDVLERFVEEAQIGGQLQHPGIVPVYEIGLQHGQRPFFAMKLVRGRTLAGLLAQRRDPSADRRRFLGIFEQVCQTMAYAHARGVVHRDLKPGNVMVGSFGEVQVVDWGFAKVLRRGGVADEARSAAAEPATVSTVRSRPGSGTSSVAGSVLGTPAYMPPEQALGDVARMDERSDVFSLGALLCELLTGKPPYTEEHGELIPQAAAAALGPAKARLQESDADADLAALALHCLAPAPQDRPATAQVVAERIGSYLTAAEERAQQARIHAAAARVRARATVLLSAAAILVVLLAGAGLTWLQQEAQARRTQATSLVTEALQEATAHQARAQATGIDVSLWEQALGAARRAEQHARSTEVTTALRSQASGLRAKLEAEQAQARERAARQARDETMRTALVRLRIPPDDNVREKGWTNREARRLEGEYGDAFRTYLQGGDVLATPAVDAARALGEGSLAVELAAALDHWALARHDLAGEAGQPDPTVTIQLQTVAGLLDPDPWRQGLRQLLPEATAQRAALEALAQSADHETLPALSSLLLGRALVRARAWDVAVGAYRAGHERHPEDFSLCFGLGLVLEQCDPPRMHEAVEQYRAARALEPGMKEVQHRLGLALRDGGRLDEAAALFQRLVRVDPGSADFHGDLGVTLARRGEIEAAATCFRRSLEILPDGASAHFNLGLALLRQGKTQDAVVHYLRAVEIKPGFGKAHLYLANALERQGKVDDAIAHYSKALELEPGQVQAHTNLGSLLSQRRRDEEAEAHLRRAVDLDPKETRPRYNLGLLLARHGRTEEAISHYRQVLELDPKFAQAHVNLCQALSEQGKTDEAIAHVRKAIELDPRLVAAHYNLANLLARQGKAEEARAHYRQTLEIDPRYVAAHVNLGILLREQGSSDEAIAHYRKALELDPRHVLARINLGDALLARGQPDEAIANYRKALEVDPRQVLAHTQLGHALAQHGRVEEAVAHFRQAVDLQPKNASAHYNLGFALSLQGSDEEAAAHIGQALELQPRHAMAHAGLGNLLRRRGRIDEAIAHYLRALEIDPRSFAAHYNLAIALQQQDRIEEAIDHYRQALAIRPKDVAAHNNLGGALVEQGRIEEAIGHYHEALEIDPKDVPAHSNLGVALQRQARIKEAIACYHKALELDPMHVQARANLVAALREQGKHDEANQMDSDEILLDIVRGRRKAADAGEWVRAGMVAWRMQSYAATARTFEQAFAAHPELAAAVGAGHRYRAACAAALASASKGKGADRIDAAERARLRGLALGWLRADLLHWQQELARDPASGSAIAERLAAWQADADLQCLREGAELAPLPGAEAEVWRALWRDVQALRATAGGR